MSGTAKYDDFGRVTKVTSHTDASQNPDATTNIANQLVYAYDTVHDRIIRTDQDHADAVGSGAAHQSVHYAYDDAATSGLYTSGLRQKMATYPNGRKLHQTYGAGGSTSDVLDRIDLLEEDSGGVPGADLVKYSYNGTGRLVVTDYPQPDVALNRSGSLPGEYPKLDRFGRTKDQYWYDYTSGTVDVARIKHGYDYAGNRTWREDVLAAANSVDQDEFYAYDGLNRLKNMQRGNLSGTPYNSIASQNYEHDWALDQLGNWNTFKERYGTGSWAIDQTRDKIKKCFRFWLSSSSLSPLFLEASDLAEKWRHVKSNNGNDGARE